MRKLLATLVTGLILSFGAAANPVVDLNTADAATLARVLNGVGPAKADAIIAYREAHGPFQHIDELVKVKGIGPATIEQNRSVMSIQPVGAEATGTPTTQPAAPQPAATATAPRPTQPGTR
jgi:competence protein ComEA